MKKSNYITILLASLMLSLNVYAQETTSTTDTTQASASEDDTTTTVTSNYSNDNDNISVASVHTSNKVTHTINVDVADGESVSSTELLQNLVDTIHRSTMDDDDSDASAATMLALVNAISTMIQKGTFPSEITEDFSIDIELVQDEEGNYIAKLNLDMGDTSISSELSLVPNADGSFAVTGNVGDSALDLSISSTGDSYNVTGVIGGENVNSTMSNQVNSNTSLDNSVIQVKDADGNIVSTTVSVNNPDGTHTVTTTNVDGETSSQTYNGNTTTPYDDSVYVPEFAPESNVDALGGVGSGSVVEDTDLGYDAGDVPDTDIVLPEEFVTPES